MLSSLGKTCKETIGTASLFAASSLTLVTLAVTPATAALLHPVARVTAPLPALHLAVGRHALVRPDARLPELVPTPVTLTVAAGDTLSALAQAHLGSPARWTDLWNSNRALITNPNLIMPGWTLTVPDGAITVTSAVVPPAPPTPARVIQAPPATPRHGVTTPRRVSLGAIGGFQACVIRRESGGNPQVMNRTGHYGLYQFSFSTWVANGGSPRDFGHASVAEQNAVFATAMSKPGGRNNWAPYDGC